MGSASGVAEIFLTGAQFSFAIEVKLPKSAFGSSQGPLSSLAAVGWDSSLPHLAKKREIWGTLLLFARKEPAPTCVLKARARFEFAVRS
jgi:hypothetical protein